MKEQCLDLVVIGYNILKKSVKNVKILDLFSSYGNIWLSENQAIIFREEYMFYAL